MPLSMDSVLNVGQTRSSQATWWWVHIVGRLKPGATIEQVSGNMDGVFQQAARAGMTQYESGLSTEQRSLQSNQRRGDNVPRLLVASGARGIYDFDPNSSRAASILSAVVGLVFLIVCANVANLLLSRAAARRKELSVRLSVGATRARLVRQLLTESLVLSGLGGALGLVLAYLCRSLLPFGQEVPIDWRVFGFVAGLSAIAGVTFGLVPAFRATRLDLATAMKESSRSVSGTRSRLSKVLLVAQVAISLVLLVGAGLFLRTLSNLRSVDIGFNPDNLLMFAVNPLLNRYEPERTRQLYRQLQDELAAMPGVRSVALTRQPLLSGGASITSAWLPGQAESTNVHIMTVSPGFFQTMEIPVQLGRDFAAGDVEGAPKVAVINEAAARKLFPDGSPLGRRFGFEREQSTEVEVVGVIRDTKYNSLRDAPPPTVYQPYMQGTPRGMSVILRTAGRSNRARRAGAPCRAACGCGAAAHEHRDTDRTDRAPLRAGAAVRERVRAFRRARVDTRVNRPVRPHVLQRVAADQRNRDPHGAWGHPADRGPDGARRVADRRRRRRRARPGWGARGRAFRDHDSVRPRAHRRDHHGCGRRADRGRHRRRGLCAGEARVAR